VEQLLEHTKKLIRAAKKNPAVQKDCSTCHKSEEYCYGCTHDYGSKECANRKNKWEANCTFDSRSAKIIENAEQFIKGVK